MNSEGPILRVRERVASSSLSAARGPRRPKQARGRRTRQTILRAAIQCFEADGYDGTTTAAIAARAEIGVGTVYSYFENKRAILIEIVEDTMAPVAEAVIEHLAPDHWAGGDPRTTTRVLIDLIFQTQDLPQGMRRVLWERYFKDPDVRDFAERIWARTREAVQVFLDEVERRGLLRDIDLPSATHVIHNAVQWNAWRAYEAGDPEQVRAYAASTVDMITRFVFADPDSRDS